VSYLVPDQINAWLAATKYTVSTVEDELDAAVVAAGFGRVSTRYDTAVWVDASTTPPLVMTALSMLYAAWYLQRQISDDELTEQDYPIRLENRAYALLDAIAATLIDLPGVDPDPSLNDTKTAIFFPTDESTQLYEDDPTNPDGSPRAFTMAQVF
jgi:hypothetical protein